MQKTVYKLLLPIFFGLTLFITAPLLLTAISVQAAPPTINEYNPHYNYGHSYAITPTQDITAPVFITHPLIFPSSGITITTTQPVFDWNNAVDSGGTVVSYTLLITGSGVFTSLLAQDASAKITTTVSIYTPTQALPSGFYTWTVQAHDAAGNSSGYVSPFRFTIKITATAITTPTTSITTQVYLPAIISPDQTQCPASSTASFNLIPITGSPADHPDYLHGDLNLSLRGYAATSAALGLVDYNGNTDSDAPQLAGLLSPNRFSGIKTVYQVNNWVWNCGTHGCRGTAITNPEVTLTGLRSTAGEAVYIPTRRAEIYGGGYKVMVLYAEEKRITIGYTRQDTVANGYAVHIEDICVDPNLLALYKAQTNSEGWHNTGQLPALRNGQAMGTAKGNELPVAITDRGSFMDSRSRKDWWVGY